MFLHGRFHLRQVAAVARVGQYLYHFFEIAISQQSLYTKRPMSKDDGANRMDNREDRHLSFKLVRQLLQPFQSQQFVSQSNFSSVFGFLQGVPRLLKSVKADTFWWDEAGLPQSGQLRVGGEKQRFDFTPLLVSIITQGGDKLL